MAAREAIGPLIERWRSDAGGTYQSWFLWDQRLKNFRSIRRGLLAVVAEIEADTFGNLYRGSSLETVVHSIAEQRQIFRGADHAFLWKPKLRIPDIYEHRQNQQAFGRFLSACLCCTEEAGLIEAIHALDRQTIKGLGPAAANLLYFLHPTLAVPFNTAIVNGYNALMGAKVKLGRWDAYLAMRQGILTLNAEHRTRLSNDLGAIAGFLFDVGSGRYPLPPDLGAPETMAQWQADLARVREESAASRKALAAAREQDLTHTQVQGWLRDLGHALGYAVWIAANDRGRAHAQGVLGDGCLACLPSALEAHRAADAIRLIDVLWLDPANERVVLPSRWNTAPASTPASCACSTWRWGFLTTSVPAIFWSRRTRGKATPAPNSLVLPSAGWANWICIFCRTTRWRNIARRWRDSARA